MGYEDRAHRHHHHHHEISIPSYFRCPISSDLMNDPVTLCTGSTYDRASIQRWLSDGNNLCPVTRKNLPTKEMIPNHTLRRLIQTWREGNLPEGDDGEEDQTPRQEEGGKKQALEKTQLEGMIHAIASSGRRREALEDLTKETKRRDVDDNGDDGDAIARLACEDAIATLAMLPISPPHRKILAHSHLLAALGSILHTGSLPARRNTAILLGNLASTREECTLLGSTNAIIEGLVRLLEEDLHRHRHRHAVQTTLRSLLAISTPLRNRVKAVEAGAVDLLVELLPERERATAELTLSLLELLCRCAEGRAAIAEHTLAIPTLSRKLFTVSDTATDAAVVILWAICKYSPPHKKIQRRVIESGVLSRLFYFVQTDYKSRIKLKAADLLTILHNSCKHQTTL